MFVAGKMFGSAEEAKAWVEVTVPMDERRHFIIIELEGEEPPRPSVIKGLNDGSIVTEKFACDGSCPGNELGDCYGREWHQQHPRQA